MNKVWMLMATLAVPTAAGAVGLGQVPGTAYRFKQPGMQIDPVISDGRVLYRSFEDPSNGPLMYTDTVPLSTVTREHVYNASTPTDARFPDIDMGVFTVFLPEGASKRFQGKVTYRPYGVGSLHTLSGAGGLQVMREATAVWNRAGHVRDAFFAWMQMGPDGDWDVYWQHGAYSPLIPGSGIQDTRNMGQRYRNDIDPTVGDRVVAWASYEPNANDYQVHVAAPYGGWERVIDWGRYPHLSSKFLVYEGHYGSSTIFEYDYTTFTMQQLVGLPTSECTQFHRPRTEANGRFVIYRAEGCADAPLLLLTDRWHGCTYEVGPLPRYNPPEDPAFYDIDEDGRIVYVSHFHGGWDDFDIVYYEVDVARLNQKC